mgnify:CR=1 FL=1
MKTLVVVVLSTVLLTGCMTGMNTAPGVPSVAEFLTEPIYLKCKGKGETTIAVGPYAGVIKSDCGDGFEYSIERGLPLGRR